MPPDVSIHLTQGSPFKTHTYGSMNPLFKLLHDLPSMCSALLGPFLEVRRNFRARAAEGHDMGHAALPRIGDVCLHMALLLQCAGSRAFGGAAGQLGWLALQFRWVGQMSW